VSPIVSSQSEAPQSLRQYARERPSGERVENGLELLVVLLGYEWGGHDQRGERK
jgi:hypothetical protein